MPRERFNDYVRAIPLIRLFFLYSWFVPDKECVICGGSFIPRRSIDKTCSLDCQVRHRRNLSRELSRGRYKPRAPRPDGECETCKARLPAPHYGRMPRWCPACRIAREATRDRKGVRRCYKCQVALPEAARRPGIAVCDNCRSEKRGNRQAYERQRTLRKYGLTQEQYDQLLASQGGRCIGCGTDDPGYRGWCIDHCHKGGHVRALMCFRCNLVVGQADENPATLRRLADWLERQTAQVG